MFFFVSYMLVPFLFHLIPKLLTQLAVYIPNPPYHHQFLYCFHVNFLQSNFMSSCRLSPYILHILPILSLSIIFPVFFFKPLCFSHFQDFIPKTSNVISCYKISTMKCFISSFFNFKLDFLFLPLTTFSSLLI